MPTQEEHLINIKLQALRQQWRESKSPWEKQKLELMAKPLVLALKKTAPKPS